ncbi:hypothetical protein OIDMADRAFT_21553 [Oidiodendron maius Zn]|uniref:Uncharacterized protein n=1 Tax=Oidiodendron maius (strain Zn) TaxID=913774 RepID=A0A0C3C2V7_OIDMZ|nr:hypothetical protein OIDMADRAFT_21553 [Oidiodendron maius Zn]
MAILSTFSVLHPVQLPGDTGAMVLFAPDPSITPSPFTNQDIRHAKHHGSRGRILRNAIRLREHFVEGLQSGKSVPQISAFSIKSIES